MAFWDMFFDVTGFAIKDGVQARIEKLIDKCIYSLIF
jgi:hypothetical protein